MTGSAKSGVLAAARLSRISPRLRGGHAGYGETPLSGSRCQTAHRSPDERSDIRGPRRGETLPHFADAHAGYGIFLLTPSRSRDALRPGFEPSLRHPTRGGGAPRDAGCPAGHPGVLVTRHARRLRGASRPQRETRASRRSTVAIFGRGPRFSFRHCLRIRRASSSRPGPSAWRAGSRASRGAVASRRRRTPRLAPPSGSPLGRRPSMSEDAIHICYLHPVVNKKMHSVVLKICVVTSRKRAL